ncbi:MAG: glycosyltransferase family 2 protein [Bacillota bacterium]
MVEISLCMIVKNEEDVIGRCLDSVADLVDEIIVVDTGSSDRTVEIAKQYTGKIFFFPWVDDFSAARNFSFSKATKEYIFWLDADDVLLEKDRTAFRALKESLTPDISMVMMRYDIAFDAAGKPTFYYYRERLLRRDMDYRWVGPIHEVITPSGKIRHEEIAVTHRKIKAHDPDRNIRIFENMIAKGQALDKRQAFYYVRELRDHQRYADAVPLLYGIIEDELTWIENRIDACRVLADCLSCLNKDTEALQALMQSFRFDAPRAEVCCQIGKWFMKKENYRVSAFWYEQARAQIPNLKRGGFCEPDCYGYIPCIQLCVCYDRMGMHEKAREYNKEAARWKPDDPAVLFNEQYFSRLLPG